MGADDDGDVDVFYDALDDCTDADVFLDTEDRERASPGGSPVSDQQSAWPLHRAAFERAIDVLQQLLSSATPHQLVQHDPHGNTPLHVAALVGCSEAVSALLAAGAPVGARSARGWSALEEALAGRHADAAGLLLAATEEARRLKRKAERAALLHSMTALPDYSMQVCWQLGSSVPGLGLLLRRYAPHDTLTIWKVGRMLRMDGSLMGLDTKSPSLIPQWKRGHYSLVVDGDTPASAGATPSSSRGASGAVAALCDPATPAAAAAAASGNGVYTGHHGAVQAQQQQAHLAAGAAPSLPAPRLLFLNHTKRTYIDIGADKKTLKAEAAEEEAAEAAAALEVALSRDVDRVRVKARRVTFTPVAGWLTASTSERVEGWPCSLWEAGADLVAVNTSKAHLALPPGATWGDYLAAHYKEDSVREVAIDPFNPASMAPPGAGSSRHHRPHTGLGDSSHRSHGSRQRPRAGAAEDEQDSSSSSGSQEGGPWRPRAAGSSSADPGDPAGSSRAGDSPGSSGSEADEEEGGGSGRRLRARCWMCSTFPMSLSQLLPLLEVAGSTITPLSKVAAFLGRAPPALAASFPVKVQVPLLFTVHATVSFKHFQQLGPPTASLADWERSQANSSKGASSSKAGLMGMSAKGAAWAASLLKRGEDSGQAVYPAAPPPPWFQVPAGYSRKLLGEVAEKHGLFKGMGGGGSKASSSGGGWKDMGGDVEF